MNIIDFNELNELFNLTSLKKYRNNLQIMITSATTCINIKILMDIVSDILKAFNKKSKQCCC